MNLKTGTSLGDPGIACASSKTTAMPRVRGDGFQRFSLSGPPTPGWTRGSRRPRRCYRYLVNILTYSKHYIYQAPQPKRRQLQNPDGQADGLWVLAYREHFRTAIYFALRVDLDLYAQ